MILNNEHGRIPRIDHRCRKPGDPLRVRWARARHPANSAGLARNPVRLRCQRQSREPDTGVTRPDGELSTLNYGATTTLLDNMVVPTGNYSYTYDATSAQLTGITAPDNGTLTYNYDGFLLTNSSLTGDVAGSVDRTDDSDFRNVSRSVNEVARLSQQIRGFGYVKQASAMLYSLIEWLTLMRFIRRCETFQFAVRTLTPTSEFPNSDHVAATKSI